MSIVVLEADAAGVSFEELSEFGDLKTYDHTPQDKVAERIKNATIVVPNKCIIDESVMKDAQNIKLICEAATGYNNIDIDYCTSRGITVTNSRGYSTEAVVQHTFALLLSLWEKIGYYSNYVNSGEYSSQESFTHMGREFHELNGKRFGIIGLGAIGRRVAEVATAFGMDVVYYSASGSTYDVPYKQLDFERLLATSDVISCHAPLNEKTRGLMNYKAFKKCKPGGVFLNLGRGPIVVEGDLVRAIEDGLIAGAALDVYEKEPLPADSPLMKYMENHSGDDGKEKLVLTPHMAWAPLEARKRLVSDVAESIRAWLDGQPRSVVTQ
ncbi:MAG: D-2-hydroxyacid dehydrogenase [Eubacterium sp.]|nr:D-2-hydroxyacid dehydrogenase [Eubacterium sp.]